ASTRASLSHVSMSSGFAFALAARSVMKDTTSAGSGILALVPPPADDAPGGAAPGRTGPAPGPPGERIRVQMARPAARNPVSTAEAAAVTCQRRAAEAAPPPGSAAPHSVQNLAAASAFVPHWAQKRTDIGDARDTNGNPPGGPAASNRWRLPSILAQDAAAGLQRESWIPPTRAGIRLALSVGHACPRASRYCWWRTTRRSDAPPDARSRRRAGW